jgi:hypothetical protein
MRGNTVVKQKQCGKYFNNSQCFKEKNYEAKSTKTILKKKEEEKIHKKSHVGKHCSNP